jgi:UDP-3-O-[3-hydroxymyristoyl] N-acetylglucosamine deacetylase
MIDFFSGTEGYRVQKTLRRPCVFKGHGIHSGLASTIQLIPCEPNTGTVFLKKAEKQTFKIPAHFDYVTSTSLATSLGLRDIPESRVSTVEHLLAALFAIGINNVLVEVRGPEIPILDGSALPFIEGILDAGIELQDYSSKILRILKPIKVYEHGAICELLPRRQLRLTTSIDFNHPKIGAQTFAMDVTPRSFADHIGCARTFGFLSDLDRLKSKNLALGASLENVLGFSEGGILNPEGMRFSDECVRHKWLDALGDLALCGSWVEGELVSFRGGHAIHLALLKALNNHKTHWELSKPELLTHNKVISLRK